MDLIKRLFPYRSCTKTITGKDPRPCLEYYIHRCVAPCSGLADLDLRTDVYSLGVILFQMLTSKFPYEVTGNIRDVMGRIMNDDPARPGARYPSMCMRCDITPLYGTPMHRANETNHS